MDESFRVAKALYAAHNAHDAHVAASLYSEDGQHSDAAFGGATRGRKSIEEFLADFYRVFPDIEFTIENIVASDRAAFVRYRFVATMRADGFGYVATGQAITMRGVQAFDIVDGHVAATEDFWDFTTFDRQLGSTT